MQLAGRRYTVMGLGRHGGGVAAARYLAREGAIVTVTDLAEERELAASLEALADVCIHRYQFGGHVEADFRNADAVVVNPAVRPDHPLLQLARERRAVLTSETDLFLSACPAHVVGVTGTVGKSTTAAMISTILDADRRRVYLGGNIGRSLLGEVEQMREDDWVVLELSSFQLAHLSERAPLPRRAVITNCMPNHVDWHGSFAAYRAAKERLVAGARDLLVLDPIAPGLAAWSAGSARTVCQPPAATELPPLRVPGDHNRKNAALAAAFALAVGCSAEAVNRGLALFAGLPHRLQLVDVRHQRLFYNDSMATAPESVVAVLEALDRPVWLLAGGRDKGNDYTPLFEAIAGRARGACFFGAARQKLLEGVEQALAGNSSRTKLRPSRMLVGSGAAFASVSATPKPHASPACSFHASLKADDLHATEHLTDALAWCFERSSPDDAIVLSPGCASHDQFRDYRHRAAVFIDAVTRLRAGC